ncbi:UDP-N-acetylmuramoyl-L-alanyl-D-glutamate--2,6-diaminopimelate ligase [Melaminivora sp.]|uniref:UDP-N-acetylmuramoyl-L-alanyl-D-glutamate--2, 6-diaminopimelate ligase n=1 Tax=Melaminivora sp. TaxID=1933032 RepID=UPI0028ACE78A|nr:UDP-N-acetylmuramoyl-L-alanyl-D-glutamate--2,6-diaminopimelate ligase [Melaminivora sp.]
MSGPQTLATLQQAVDWLRAHTRGTLRTDSRQVTPGDAFIAWPGAATDGRAHVAAALARGAAACLVEAGGVQAFDLGGDARIAALHGLKAATGRIAAEWFGRPSERLQVLAVTGTNGKTSSAWWLAEALNALASCVGPAAAPQPKSEQTIEAACGLIGTLGVGIPPDLVATGLTTPDPVQLQRAFADFARAGLSACAIEASSIGLAEQRLAGTHIRAALFTNFTQDHLDYHADMAAYWQAKRVLFDWPGLQAAVVNIDDARGAELHDELQGRAGLDLWSISLQPGARLVARGITTTGAGLAFTVAEGAHAVPLQTRLVGLFNVSNLLGVIAALRALGVPLDDAVGACVRLGHVPGRMQQLAGPGQPLVAVDYAHTPDALAQALAALAPAAAQRGGQLWCVFGCGGNRDRAKRPLMGAVAQQGADRVVVTSDNPRGEAPEAIIDEILQGTRAGADVRAEADRAAAIAQVVAAADARDVVLIAGKGHEDYQETAGVRLPFSDAEHARAALARRAARAGGADQTDRQSERKREPRE